MTGTPSRISPMAATYPASRHPQDVQPRPRLPRRREAHGRGTGLHHTRAHQDRRHPRYRARQHPLRRQCRHPRTAAGAGQEVLRPVGARPRAGERDGLLRRYGSADLRPRHHRLPGAGSHHPRSQLPELPGPGAPPRRGGRVRSRARGQRLQAPRRGCARRDHGTDRGRDHQQSLESPGLSDGQGRDRATRRSGR
jgi:hypothetical protein